MSKIGILKHISVTFVLFSIDVLILSSNIIAVAALGVIGVSLFRLLMSWRTNVSRKEYLYRAGIYLLMVLMIFAGNTANRNIAKSRADLLIHACEKYKTRYNQYPNRLEDIVPEFTNKIPSAKYTLMENKFMYLADNSHHSLVYTLAPFGRSAYSFEDHSWRSD